MDALDHFFLFSLLSIEVRLMIIHWAFPRGRHINVSGQLTQWEPGYIPPEILAAINHEFRREVSKHYFFLPRLRLNLPAGVAQSGLLVNPVLDLFWTTPEFLLLQGFNLPSAVSALQTLEIRESGATMLDIYTLTGVTMGMLEFTGLKVLDITVPHQEGHEWHNAVEEMIRGMRVFLAERQATLGGALAEVRVYLFWVD